MKQTRQKQTILETVQRMKTHPTADDVYKEICKQNQDVGIATVYRNLNAFAEKGLLRKVTLPNAADRFDYRLDSHEHFLCKSCGKLQDVEVQVEITPTQKALCYDSYSLILFGLCEDCAKKNNA